MQSTSSFLERTNRFLSKLKPYIPGKPISELQREYNLQRISKLASNENPSGASPVVQMAVQSEMLNVSRYPDGNAYSLRHAIAKRLDRKFEEVVVGNGSNELLELVARVFAGPGDEIIFSQYAFAVYPISTMAVGATPVEVPAIDWGHDLDAMADAVTDKTKVIYLANPNNPTGTCFGKEVLERFLNRVPSEVIVVLDEAYTEYVSLPDYPNGIAYIERYPNLLISRTFSKAYGLAALRLGFMVGNQEIVSYINKIRAPFNVNSMAQAAATAALKDQVFVKKAVQKNQQGMTQLIEFFEKYHISFIPSQGNFVCFYLGDKMNEWNQVFLEKGVILRPVDNYGMMGFIRVSIGSPSEMQHFMAVMIQLLKDNPLSEVD